jgi:ABC-type oligopeptide transport system substrate-binding subunit
MKLGKDLSSPGRQTLSKVDFIRVLAHPATAPVPRLAMADANRFGRQPVCAGPYRLAAPWRPEDREIRLVRSAHYAAANEAFTGGGAGYADEVVFRVEPDPVARSAAFDRGEVEVAPVAPGDLGRVRGIDAARVVEGVSPAVEYVGVPASAGSIFARPEVRRALSLAIDRRAVAAALGNRQPATGFYSPTLGRELFRTNACASSMPAGGDVEGARAALRSAGISLEGKSIPFAFNDELGNRALVETVSAQWSAAFGAQVVPQAMPWEAFVATGTGNRSFPGAFRMSWSPRYPGPDEYVAPLFTSAGVGVGNFSRFADVDLDLRLRRDARRATEEDDMTVEYKRLEKTLCNTMPLIPVTYPVLSYRVATDRLAAASNITTERGTGQIALRELYVKGAGQ